MLASAPQLDLPLLTKQDISKLITIGGIILVWVYVSGIGKFVAQNQDHDIRNAMFKLLIEEDWPIIYLNPPVEYFDKPIALVYYFAFWLPSAVVGKLFGETAGWFMQAIWAASGVFLFYFLFLARFIKKLVVWPLIVIVFFSGLDIFGMFLLGYDITQVSSTAHIEW
jgi:hypothetical protein